MRRAAFSFLRKTGLLVVALFLLSVDYPKTSEILAADKSLESGANAVALNSHVKSTGVDAATRALIEEGYGSLPLSFEANKGQVNDAVKFLARSKGYTLFLT
jgi:hypothetical protein